MTPPIPGTPPDLLLATAKADRSMVDLCLSLAASALSRGDRPQAMADFDRARLWRTSAEQREAMASRALSTPVGAE